MPDGVHVFDRLLEIALLIQQDMSRELGPAGLTAARTHLLWEVHHRGPSTQQALAAALQVSPRNVTGLVDAVEKGGFARREPHPTDRRATLVTLTEQGTRAMADMVASRGQIAAHLVSDFDTAQLQRFTADLDAVTARLHELMDDGSPM
ncbi:MarR family transcriptional regulator [Modestobacter sp. VKM Ac-2979]|uniref:MarR family winged helix-turn-helix transcriptional regulator n=1 Tax=unclassified Modestobacter TaxID=2643866 RepID=UPI0022AB9677|nr:MULTISPECIES: MarR family transcriptional regulator [unclassified Modestobacter]MCZ2810711.1 MarR family transcriptional regulator [Modestobacter sp. VKM Ac-2979]MCZ2840224.1 MarR family transcriptional regulator [Modestobacter sp. VKM Ac-2980]